MIDMLEEIFSSIRKNKLRTFLTGFSVGWGIFMLIILLGAGNGLGNAVISNFNFNSVNSMTIYPGNTSDVHGGLQKNRQIKLKTDDAEYLSSSFPQTIKIITPVITI